MSGEGLVGARVRIWSQAGRTERQRGLRNLGSLVFDGSDRLITDAQGRFRTPCWLRADLGYSLEVEAPGMLEVNTETIEPATWHTTRFADVVLRQAARLRAVNGRVVDRQRRPVAGAIVWQSGDGPRRTETTTDDEGRFQLSGIYDGAAFLFVRSEGFRLQGARIAAADKTCEIALHGSAETAKVLTTLPAKVPIEEQRRLAMSLVEPLIPTLREPIFTPEHYDLMRIIGRCDPARALELGSTVLAGQQAVAVARQAAATSLAETDLNAAREVVALLVEPRDRAQVCMHASDVLASSTGEKREKLLEEALLHARAEPDPGMKAYLVGQIAERWLDVGEEQRGTMLLREGRALAEAMPAASETRPLDDAVFMAGRFAGSLARIDGPAALRLIEGYPEGGARDVVRSGVARGLAGHDAAEGERLVGAIEWDWTRFSYSMAVFHRMGRSDAERASRMARHFPEASQQAYALGMVAHGLAGKDRAAAARLLDEAYGILERAGELGRSENRNYDRPVTAAALLPLAEEIDPRLVEGYFWRTLALRAPRSDRGGQDWVKELHFSRFAALIARYDQAAARDLLERFAGRWRELAGTSDDRLTKAAFMSAAIIDARWAYEQVQALPDVPAGPTHSPKLAAARAVAEWLGRAPRDLWPAVYTHCALREPNSPDADW